MEKGKSSSWGSVRRTVNQSRRILNGEGKVIKLGVGKTHSQLVLKDIEWRRESHQVGGR